MLSSVIHSFLKIKLLYTFEQAVLWQTEKNELKIIFRAKDTFKPFFSLIAFVAPSTCVNTYQISNCYNALIDCFSKVITTDLWSYFNIWIKPSVRSHSNNTLSLIHFNEANNLRNKFIIIPLLSEICHALASLYLIYYKICYKRKSGCL